MAASGFGLDLGPPTCTAAIVTVVLATKCRAKATREIATSVAWMVLPLVAGLFVIVEGLDRAGALLAVSHPFGGFAAMPRLVGELAASFGVAGLCNVMNNLPAGLLAGSPLQTAHAVPGIRDAVLIGVDLGPNLSVTGSLATVLWADRSAAGRHRNRRPAVPQSRSPGHAAGVLPFESRVIPAFPGACQ
jgi:arsenical pump membrane protein